MSETKFVRTIARMERMNSSKNGNPRYRVHFEDGDSAPTEPDASISYAIGNPEFKNVPVEFTLNGRGHITYARPIEGATLAPETQPFKPEDYGKYVCVGRNRVCGNRRDINQGADGVWVKYGTQFSSAHRTCV